MTVAGASAAGSMATSIASAEGRPTVTMSLFAAAPAQAPNGSKGEIKGMRPETVGAVAYFPLSVDAANSLRGRGTPRELLITLPGGGSVTCVFRAETRPNGVVVLTGEPVGGNPGETCTLVVDKGQVTGELELQSARYRIQPTGTGSTHAIVEVKTEAFPNESEPLRPPRG
jgi:hypothetical protein